MFFFRRPPPVLGLEGGVPAGGRQTGRPEHQGQRLPARQPHRLQLGQAGRGRDPADEPDGGRGEAVGPGRQAHVQERAAQRQGQLCADRQE